MLAALASARASRCRPAPASPRDLYVVYGAIKAEILPVALRAEAEESRPPGIGGA